MNSIEFQMTATSPSRFGMPISGHAFGVTTPATAARTAAAAVVRDRAGDVKGQPGLAQHDFPGTSAWRPPTC